LQIKVFIGSEPKTKIVKKVLEYSIRKHTKADILFPGLEGEDDWRERKDAKHQGVGTGFSLLRWDIPRRCGHQGFAVYLDTDIICLEDIQQLFEADCDFPNDKCSIWCTYQPSRWFKEATPETSVMLIDCAKAKFNQPDLAACITYIRDDTNRTKYVKIMRALKHQNAPQRIPESYNHLNNYVKDKTKFLHYTIEPKQPWYDPKHPHRDLWEALLKETIDSKIVTKDEIKEAVANYVPHIGSKRGTGMNPYWKKYT